MNSKDISTALKTRLAGLSPSPDVNWPNVNSDPGEVPRFEVVFSSRVTTDPALKGGSIHREEGIMRVIICTAHGTGEDAGLDYLDDLRGLFPKGQRISITGGVVTITAEPTADGPAFPDDTTYRLPVAIRYSATAT